MNLKYFRMCRRHFVHVKICLHLYWLIDDFIVGEIPLHQKNNRDHEKKNFHASSEKRKKKIESEIFFRNTYSEKGKCREENVEIGWEAKKRVENENFQQRLKNILHSLSKSLIVQTLVSAKGEKIVRIVSIFFEWGKTR